MKLCPGCCTPMIEKPLFTSFYWECPKCDGKPSVETPDHLQVDPLPWEMPNWSDLCRQIPDDHYSESIFGFVYWIPKKAKPVAPGDLPYVASKIFDSKGKIIKDRYPRVR